MDQIAAELAEITPVLKRAFEEAGPSLDAAAISVFGEGLEERQKSERLASLNVRMQELAERRSELEAAAKQRDAIARAEEWLARPASAAPVFEAAKSAPGYKSFTELAIGDLSWLKGGAKALDLDGAQFVERELKTVMSTGAGFAPQAIRTGVVVPAAYQSPSVIDLIPTVPTSEAAYVFMRQSTRTNNAAEVAESVNGDLKSLAESAYAWEQITETVRRIGHFVPVTDEQMEDAAGLESVIRNDMITGLRQRLSSQIMNGNGSAPNLAGFLDDAHTPTDVNGSGLFFADIVDKLIEAVRVNGYTEPTAVICHPSDWHAYRRSTTTDGVYLAGRPSENIAPVIWGLPVVLTTEIAAGTVHAGNYADFSRLAIRRGVEVSMSTEHASFFVQGVRAVKAEMRAAFAVLRETAFAKSNDVTWA